MKLQVGDKVRVMDKGLLMLQKFAPPGAKPNNEGIVQEIMEDGALLIEFPIGAQEAFTGCALPRKPLS